jgi:exodeoxyribonuclease-5
MEWSPKQDAALKAVDAWLKDPNRKQVFRLFGYAGTGKTTLAIHFAEQCGGRVLFGAFTGKAASVMRARGCHEASTIHQLIYKPAPKSAVRLLELRGDLAEVGDDPAHEEKRARILKEIKEIEEDLKRPAFTMNFDSEVETADLVIIDECSMVGEQMGEDLLSFGTPVLVLGDPAQLPPIGSAGYFTSGKPDIMLTEIHRQAEQSPIIHLATQVRTGNRLDYGTFGESLVVRRSDFAKESAMAHDQMLVGKNVTRRACNARARTLLGRETHLPEPTDKLVCLRNDHQLGLLNGELWRALDVVRIDPDTLGLTIRSEATEAELNCEAHTAIFEGRELGFWEKRDAQEFDFGYALTTHKAQGSQWGSVLVFDESGVFRQDARRWLYTAITRAADRVTIVRQL